MSLPNQIGAYGPELDLFDRAIDDPKGIRVHAGSETAAEQMRFRLHQARALQRVENTRIYDKTDPRHGNCEYDKLICRLREDTEHQWWVYIERHGVEVSRIESLSEIEP